MSKENSMFNAIVRDIASDGRGIVTDENGRVFFVSGVWFDEEGEFKVTAIQGRSGTAELVRLTKVSPNRITPPCSYHGTDNRSCGGCPWQFVDYESQLAAKKLRVELNVQKALARILPKKKPDFIQRFVQKRLKNVVASGKNLAYRSRAQFKSDGKQIGFLSFQSRELVDIEQCLVLSEKNQQTFTHLRNTLPNTHWSISKAMLKKQHWTRIDIDEDVEPSHFDDANLTQLAINERRLFQQANKAQNRKMKDWLNKKCQELLLESSCRIEDMPIALELFCGSGNFTEVLSNCDFSEIFAVESSKEAIQVLKSKNLVNVTGLTADLYSESAFESLYRRESKVKQATVLVLDPPRDGLKNTQGLMPKKNAFQDVFYISCNLATFCRDLEFFYQQGFRLEELTPIDQFPHTPHIELMAHLRKPAR